MECSTIMRSPATRLYLHNTVREAIDLLIEQHMYNLPVVDKDEIFVGEISTRRLTGLLLPASLRMKHGLEHAGFMRDNLEDLRDRLAEVNNHTIEQYIAKDITVVYPDSPLMDALLLLYHKFIRIPVVERDSRRLVGGISFITVLRALEPEHTIARQQDGE